MKRSLFSFWVCVACACTRAEPSAPPQAQAPAPVAASRPKIESALVTVVVGARRASGFVVAPGVVLTHRHVLQDVEKAASVTILFADPRTEEYAIFERAAYDVDLAVLRCVQIATRCLQEGGLSFGQGAALRAGAAVHTIRGENGVARGTIRRRGVRIHGQVHLESDLALSDEYAGAPLLDANDRVVGVLGRKVVGLERAAFALPIEYAVEGPNAVLSQIVSTATTFSPKMQELIAEDMPQLAAEYERRAAPSWPPRPDPTFVISEATIGRSFRLVFKLALPMDRPLVAKDSIDLLHTPRRGEGPEAARYVQLPRFEILNTIERPDTNTRTYWVKIEAPRVDISSSDKYYLRFERRLFSNEFELKSSWD